MHGLKWLKSRFLFLNYEMTSEQESNENGSKDVGRGIISGITSGLGVLMEVATLGVNFGFGIAKESTKIGFGIPKYIFKDAYPVHKSLEVAELVALQGIEIGHFWTDFGIDAAEKGIHGANHLFGNTETALSIKEFIVLLRRELKDQGIDDVSIIEIMSGLSSWFNLQEETALEWESRKILEGVEPVTLTETELHCLQKYMQFSMAAYGKMFTDFLGSGTVPFPSLSRFTGLQDGSSLYPDHDAFCSFSNIDPDDLLHSSFIGGIKHSLKHQPTFFIHLDHELQKVVVTMRGTLSVHDLMLDLVCEPFNIEHGGESYKVHEGMYRAAYAIANSATVKSTLSSALASHPTYGIALTGHSLGAGIL